MIISVNIVETYPVKWSIYKVFRDFIQNFYDAAGFNNFHSEFKYTYNNKTNVLEMFVENIQFSYEWLIHIGASTKTENSQNNAGFFGEGFKIASLCALRDYNINVTMESRDWRLNVFFKDDEIDNKKIKMLSYKITKVKDKKRSKLTLQNISNMKFNVFKTAIDSFYYPENPMLGERIYENSYCAIYSRSKNSIPEGLPYVSQFGKKGAVFCKYQMLGTNPFNCVVCLHNFDKSDRERNTLYGFEVIDVFEKIVGYLTPEAAIKLLEIMRKQWNCKKKKSIDIYSWESTISFLVNRIAASNNAIKIFVNKYPNIICLKRIYTIEDANRRTTARSWYRNTCSEQYIITNHCFLRLGYKTLEDLCEENGGFAEDTSTNEIEEKCFYLLYDITNKIYKDFFVFTSKPGFRTIKNKSSVYHGMATLVPNKSKTTNKFGMKIRYNIRLIHIKRSVFAKENFYDALSTYIHELCHMFGGDSSQAFSAALTNAMTILLINTPLIQEGFRQWCALFDTPPTINEQAHPPAE